MPDALHGYLNIWERKPVLRMIYDDFYDRIVEQCVSGITVEMGGGIGNLKRRLPHVIATDIQFADWLDCVADAQYLPFAASTVGEHRHGRCFAPYRISGAFFSRGRARSARWGTDRDG